MGGGRQLLLDVLDDDSGSSPSAPLVSRRSGWLYGVHAYHTKVPVAPIVASIEAHTEPGELVVDPFCGSGMTGVAAALSGRRAFVSDLSPAATHIAYNYATPCDPAAFRRAAERVLAAVGDEVSRLYATRLGQLAATVEYLVWSDIRTCPNCGTTAVLWDHRDTGLRQIRCGACGTESQKAAMPLAGEQAVEANLSIAGRQRVTRPPIPSDLGLEDLPDELSWHPSTPFDSARPMWRRGHADLGIRTVADFYSRRNLAALALLWSAANREPEPRLRSALRFSLTAIANRASRRYQWNAKRPTNVLGGTLYISSLRYEWNVLSLWRRKIAAVERMFRENNDVRAGAVEVHQGSATSLPLADGAAHYCFTDPPFGANIVYSDSSLLWEAWLDDLTDRGQEAIIVSSGDTPKSLEGYGQLLGTSFAEVARVLKQDRVATVVFQATSAAVWATVQAAASRAGLRLIDATTLDKGQPSFKQIKARLDGERVAATDIVLTFLNGKGPDRRIASTPVEAADDAIRAAVRTGRPTTTPHLYAAINARLLRDGHAQVLDYADVAALLREHFTSCGGGWTLPA